MSWRTVRQPLGKGATATVIEDGRMQTVTLRALWLLPLRRQDATRAALLPMVLRRGTMSHPDTASLRRQLQEMYGARLGAGVAKVGDVQVMRVGIRLPAPELIPQGKAVLRRAIDLLQELVLEPTTEGGQLRSQYVEEEKSQLRRRIESLIDDRIRYSLVRCVEEVCRGEGYAVREFGYLEDLDAVDAAELSAFHQRALREGHLHLYAVGRLDPEAVLRQLSRSFGDFSGGQAALPRQEPSPVEEGVRRVSETLQDIGQVKLTVGYKTASCWRDPEMPWLLLADGVLGAFPTSRLFQKIREERSLAYYVMTSGEWNKGLLFVMSGASPQQVPVVEQIMQQELEALASRPPEVEELQTAKRLLRDALHGKSDEPAQLASLDLEWQLAGAPWTLEKLLDALEAAGPQDVMEAAGRIRPQVVFLLTPERQG